MDFPSKEPVMLSFDVSHAVSVVKMLNKQLIYW